MSTNGDEPIEVIFVEIGEDPEEMLLTFKTQVLSMLVNEYREHGEEQLYESLVAMDKMAVAGVIPITVELVKAFSNCIEANKERGT